MPFSEKDDFILLDGAYKPAHHISSDGPLGGCPSSAVVNDAAVNVDVHHLCGVLTCTPLKTCQEWYRPSIARLSVFGGTSVLISILAEGTCPHTVQRVPLPSVSSTALAVIRLPCDSHSDGERWNFSVLLICVSLVAKDAECPSCSYWPLVFLLRKIC